MSGDDLPELLALLRRCAEALERLAPVGTAAPDLGGAEGFVWQAARGALLPVAPIARVEAALLCGIDRQKALLIENTCRFAAGLPANNAMLWGARGMGKSALVKAAHAEALQRFPDTLALIEIARDELASTPALLTLLRAQPRRCLLFCDDLSFETEDADYKALKSVLEGGIMGRPGNVLFYATSNRRHLMPREMIENERAAAIHDGEAVEEKVSLSDRFGLWIGFCACDQAAYHQMVRAHAQARALPIDDAGLLARADAWAMGRGARSGRVALQFIDDLESELRRDGGSQVDLAVQHRR